MSYIPGAGLKKPLNQLENPVYPDIKKGPPRFVWSRKHWTVDEGATLRDTEPYTQFIQPAILAQSRDYNQTVYGKSSHKEIVNAEFRPPLISYYEDIAPLSRLPTKIHAIVPRTNPSTAGHDGGTSGYTARNQRHDDVEGALTDRIGTKEWRPTFFAPIERPEDNSVLPDLELKLPNISVSAGWNVPVFVAPKVQEDYDLQSKITSRLDSGYTTQVNINGDTGMENYVTHDNRPRVAAHSGVNTGIQINGAQQDYELFDNRPQVSVTAGTDTGILLNGDTGLENYTAHNNRPQVAAHSGIESNIQINGESNVDELFTKLGETPLQVLNPGAEDGYRERMSSFGDVNENIQDKRPTYSYSVTPQYEYRDRNELTNKPYFREKLQAEKSYGQISHSGGAIPRSGISQPENFLRGRMHERMNPKKKKPMYRF